MTTFTFNTMENKGRNAWNTGTRYFFECKTSKGAIYRGNIELGDCGSSVADCFRLKDFKNVNRATKFGADLEVAALNHLRSQA